jgi:hypothetical protein
MSKPIHVGGAMTPLAYPFTDAEDRQFRADRDRERVAVERQDFTDLKTMASKAFRGVYGESAKGAAIEWSRFYAIRSEQIDGLGPQHKAALEALRVALRKVPDRVNG